MMNQEDLQQFDQTETSEQEPIDYKQKWRNFYEEEKVKYDDVEEEITRERRYNNLPTSIKIGGEILVVRELKSIRERIAPKALELLEESEEIERIIQEQMKNLNIKPEDGKRFWDLYNQDALSAEEYQELVGFTEKMEQIIQAGLKEGYKYTNFAQ